MQDNHNQDADGDHDDDGDDDGGDYGPFSSKCIQYNSSYDEFYVNKSAPHNTPTSQPLPLTFPTWPVWVTNHWR